MKIHNTFPLSEDTISKIIFPSCPEPTPSQEHYNCPQGILDTDLIEAQDPTSDLVKRLRAGYTIPTFTPTEFAEAADRIEELEKENRDLRAAIIALRMGYALGSLGKGRKNETN